jgi:hypothetical protein
MVVSIVALALAAPGALAKGASEATITGPGLDEPIVMAGEGFAGGEDLMQLAESAGFFPAVFAQTPDPMLDTRPSAALGPKYTIAYVMPGPNNQEDTLVQELYPYATPSPVSYVEPEQTFWTTEETRGGWYVSATSSMKDVLVAAGLPEAPPTNSAPSSDSPWTVLGPVLVLIAVAVIGGFAVSMTRRRPRTA